MNYTLGITVGFVFAFECTQSLIRMLSHLLPLHTECIVAYKCFLYSRSDFLLKIETILETSPDGNRDIYNIVLP